MKEQIEKEVQEEKERMERDAKYRKKMQEEMDEGLFSNNISISSGHYYIEKDEKVVLILQVMESIMKYEF